MIATLAAALVAGCAGAGSSLPASGEPETQAALPPDGTPVSEQEPAPAASVPAPQSASCEPGRARPLGTETIAYAAVLKRPASAFRRPGGKRIASFELKNQNGFPTLFGVLAAVVDERCEPTWYRVQLPIRPNGTVGFVRADTVDLYTVTTRIEIDLSERVIELFDGGKLVLRTRSAIGAEGTPTPTGRYYVNQRIRPLDPTGPWGPAALGISAFSPTLVNWPQGGPIAIHGTNDPSSVGGETSNGCLRVQNDVMERLFKRVLAGTPVLIRA